MTARISTGQIGFKSLHMQEGEICVDLFAGAGGASTAVEAVLGRVDIAVNHSPTALAVHRANHPETQHLISDVWEVDPLTATRGRPVFLLWASPDCKHFSNAKGDVPLDQKIRSLAWVVAKWAHPKKGAHPRMIVLENVREFEKWGPLDKKTKKPIKARAGETFRRFRKRLERYGYVVEWRVLDAADFGAPTRRKRLFLIARRDGVAIRWPEPTHGPGRLPYHTAAECIDWSLPCPSIFMSRKEIKKQYGVTVNRPLRPKTLWRIAQGIKRFVFDNPKPFVLKVNHGKLEPRHEDIDAPLSTVTAKQRGHALIVPTLQQSGYGERPGQAARVPGLHQPLGTIVACGQKHALVTPFLAEPGQRHGRGQSPATAPVSTIMGKGRHALVAAFLNKHYGDPKRKKGGGRVVGSECDQPIGTVTARDHHSLTAVALAKFRGTSDGHPGCADINEPMPTITAGGDKGGVHIAEVRAFLTAYYGNDGTGGQELDEPMRTVTTKHRLGLVTIEGTEYQIVDIGFRMLEPHELLRAQFGTYADGYDLSAAKTKKAKIYLIGNSVPPELGAAVLMANAPQDMLRAA